MPEATPPRVLWTSVLISTLDRFSIGPMLLAVSADFGIGVGSASHAASAYFLAYGATQPVWSLLSDRLGRVRTMRIALVLASLAGIASAFAPGLAWLVTARAITGGTFSAVIPGSLTYVGDTVPAATRQRPITDLMTGVALGTALATLIAGLVASYATWRLAFVLTACAAAALVVPLGRVPEPPGAKAAARRPSSVWAGWPIVVLVLAFAEGAILLGGFTFLPAALDATGVGTASAGAITSAYGFAVLALARLVGVLSRTIRPGHLVAVGGSCAVAGLAIVVPRQDVVATVAACVLLGGAWAFMHSTLQTWATEVAPAARALAVALFATSLFAGSAAGAAAGGLLAERGSYSVLFLAATVIAIPLATAATVARLRYRG